ncbi:MAG: hypothetical protein WCH07_04365 [Deltaproteobacteria bacterium]
MSNIIRHSSGFIEISTAEGLLILTQEEFERAARRGASVDLNREYADNKEGCLRGDHL